MISLLLFVFLVTTVLVKYILHMRHMERYVKHLQIQGRVFPFIGNAHLLLGKTSVELIKEITEYTRKTGTPYKAYVGPLLFVTIGGYRFHANFFSKKRNKIVLMLKINANVSLELCYPNL